MLLLWRSTIWLLICTDVDGYSLEQMMYMSSKTSITQYISNFLSNFFITSIIIFEHFFKCIYKYRHAFTYLRLLFCKLLQDFSLPLRTSYPFIYRHVSLSLLCRWYMIFNVHRERKLTCNLTRITNILWNTHFNSLLIVDLKCSNIHLLCYIYRLCNVIHDMLLL